MGNFSGDKIKFKGLFKSKKKDIAYESTKMLAQKQTHFLQHLMDTIPSPVFYKDKNGLYQGCNKAFETYIGPCKDKLIGKSVDDIAPKDLADIYCEMDAILFREPGVQVYEASVQYTDGTRHTVIFHKATYLNPDHSLGGLVGVVTDITDRKKVEEVLESERKRLFSILDELPACVYLLASDYTIRYANKYFHDLFGVPGEKPCYEFLCDLPEPCKECITFKIFKYQKSSTSAMGLSRGEGF